MLGSIRLLGYGYAAIYGAMFVLWMFLISKHYMESSVRYHACPDCVPNLCGAPRRLLHRVFSLTSAEHHAGAARQVSTAAVANSCPAASAIVLTKISVTLPWKQAATARTLVVCPCRLLISIYTWLARNRSGVGADGRCFSTLALSPKGFENV
jgi:hypothetical protein